MCQDRGLSGASARLQSGAVLAAAWIVVLHLAVESIRGAAKIELSLGIAVCNESDSGPQS